MLSFFFQIFVVLLLVNTWRTRKENLFMHPSNTNTNSRKRGGQWFARMSRLISRRRGARRRWRQRVKWWVGSIGISYTSPTSSAARPKRATPSGQCHVLCEIFSLLREIIIHEKLQGTHPDKTHFLSDLVSYEMSFFFFLVNPMRWDEMRRQ